MLLCGARGAVLRQPLVWVALRPPSAVRVFTSSSGPGEVARPSIETRCEHCFITFATAPELEHHSVHHCFPDRPEHVLELFPEGADVVDTVSGDHGVVLGVASNPSHVHSSVCVHHLRTEIVCDVKISRLQTVNNDENQEPTIHQCLFEDERSERLPTDR